MIDFLIDKILLLFNNKYINEIIYSIVIGPSLYLIQYNWEKYNILALFLSVFIIIKELIVMQVDMIANTSTKIKYTSMITKFLLNILLIPLFLVEYKLKYYVKLNVWIASLLYFKVILKIIDNNYKIPIIRKISKN
jgi:hypothetical protein